MYGCYARFCIVGISFARVRSIIGHSRVSANATIVIDTIDCPHVRVSMVQLLQIKCIAVHMLSRMPILNLASNMLSEKWFAMYIASSHRESAGWFYSSNTMRVHACVRVYVRVCGRFIIAVFKFLLQ